MKETTIEKTVNVKKSYEDALNEFENFIRQLKKWNFDESATFYRALTEAPKEVIDNANENGVFSLVIPFEVNGEIYSPVIWLEKYSFNDLASGFKFYKEAYDLEKKTNLTKKSLYTQNLFSMVVAMGCTEIEAYFKDAIITEFKSDFSKSKIQKDLIKIIEKYFG